MRKLMVLEQRAFRSARASSSWVRLAESIAEAMPPTDEELTLIRVRLHPGEMYSR
jgi:hypothetical protein